MLPHKKLTRKSVGTFPKMGLNSNLLRGIQTMGYKLPTPIQRKCIPVILDGHDVAVMSRTGSGKSAAFLIPLISNLKTHSSIIGCRGLILSPTRELALQTFKFTKSFTKYTSIRCAIIVGGESVEEQFNSLSYNPDIIISTPGRLSYLLKEINTFNLSKIKYLIFDEADRLFEMGFAIQLRIILNSLSKRNNKQTMLFSATMPKNLIDFTRANLINPIIIRLDTDYKISPNLQLLNFYARNDDKLSVLLLLLNTINDTDNDAMILIFANTRYHVELLHHFLELNDIASTICYGSMEQSYRTVNINRFRKKEINIMIVTDLASRGIDIPLLDYVINYQLPSNTKTFIHRVGRVARNGKYGAALSIAESIELPYLSDIYRFLNLKFKQSANWKNNNNNNADGVGKTKDDGDDGGGDDDPMFSKVGDNAVSVSNPLMLCGKVSFGCIPRSLLLPYIEAVLKSFNKSDELTKMLDVCTKAMKLYNKTKTKASRSGIYNSKQIDVSIIHPIFEGKINKIERKNYEMLNKIKKFKPFTSVFEIGGASNPNYNMMQTRRNKINIKRNTIATNQNKNKNNNNKSKNNKSLSSILDKYRDKEFYISTEYDSKSDNNNFVSSMLMVDRDKNDNDLKQFIMELDDDERSAVNIKKKLYRYNPNTRKYVTEFMGDRINRYLREKNESSKTINASNHKYGKLYREWTLKSKREIQINGSKELITNNNNNNNKYFGLRKYRHIRGSNQYYEKERAKKRLKGIKNEKVMKEKKRKDKITKFKRERFKKWWIKNKDRVKSRKAKRKIRPF